jgi:N-hydroxyarylamine O-acetyltransferase
MVDLEAYLERVGVHGRPGLHELHRAHVTAIPFENLDSRAGIPVSLDPEDLERKLVTNRRGGYCFEQNLLLKSALEELGARVELMLARVRVGAGRSARPRSHLALRVHWDGAVWLADVGFGVGTLIDPVAYGPGGPFEQAGWRFRLVADGDELALQKETEAGWEDQYAFPEEPVPLVDVEVSNWFTSTHPRSPFVTGLILARTGRDGRRLSLSDWGGLALAEATPEGETLTPVQWPQVPALIRERFGLTDVQIAIPEPDPGSSAASVALSA